MRAGAYRRYGKRAFDLAVAVPGIAFTSPLFVAIAILVRATLGRPCLFRQRRGGLHGKPFQLIKFRTMTNERGPDGKFLPDHERINRLGRILRASSLDELPELLNVVRGDMSLVGPRPFIYEYMPHYSEQQRRRHDVRPGMTGLAQVKGRNGLTWEERFELDYEYIGTMSFLGDIRLLLLTILCTLRRRGINQDARTTSSRFDERTTEQASAPSTP